MAGQTGIMEGAAHRRGEGCWLVHRKQGQKRKMKTEVEEPPSPTLPLEVLLIPTCLLTDSLNTEEGVEGLTAVEAQCSESGGAVPTHPSLPCSVPWRSPGSVKRGAGSDACLKSCGTSLRLYIIHSRYSSDLY